MVIIEDSRQQAGRHELKHGSWSRSGDVIYRSKLAVGDYCLPPEVSVDTKASMQEIAQNIGGTAQEHARFRRELQLAQEMGTKLYILIEKAVHRKYGKLLSLFVYNGYALHILNILFDSSLKM